eukprot:TRINITY_DN774248_c0_g1_i1.p1 TRINITY_DN774248_c0_g1~~TRINITY_DN774248_c0_g1_i1.p1  ORF type:complete len:259 (+),score=54.30 TRINITY_DN774248_c0_g1_i1:17-793(+)
MFGTSMFAKGLGRRCVNLRSQVHRRFTTAEKKVVDLSKPKQKPRDPLNPQAFETEVPEFAKTSNFKIYGPLSLIGATTALCGYYAYKMHVEPEYREGWENEWPGVMKFLKSTKILDVHRSFAKWEPSPAEQILIDEPSKRIRIMTHLGIYDLVVKPTDSYESIRAQCVKNKWIGQDIGADILEVDFDPEDDGQRLGMLPVPPAIGFVLKKQTFNKQMLKEFIQELHLRRDNVFKGDKEAAKEINETIKTLKQLVKLFK